MTASLSPPAGWMGRWQYVSRSSAGARWGLVMPYLQVKDGAGAWRTVIEDMGIGWKAEGHRCRPGWEVPFSSREMDRDQPVPLLGRVFLAEDAAQLRRCWPRLRSTLPICVFEGFHRSDPPRTKQPEMFLSEPRPVSNWNPTAGYYTRYGPAAAVARHRRSFCHYGFRRRVRLLFNATDLPELKPG
jgi:hypothetical protein